MNFAVVLRDYYFWKGEGSPVKDGYLEDILLGNFGLDGAQGAGGYL